MAGHQEDGETPGEAYVFYEADSKYNLIYHDNQKPDPLSFKNTKGATVVKIIEKITLKGFSDDVFVKDFLCTYRDYITPLQLLRLLKLRYDGPDPTDNQDKILRFLKEREPTRAKVVGIVAEFVSTLRPDDLTPEIRNVLLPFVELIRQNHNITLTLPDKPVRSRVKSQALSPTQMATLRFAFNPNDVISETPPAPTTQIDLTKAAAAPPSTPPVTPKTKRLTLRRKKKPDIERETSGDLTDADSANGDPESGRRGSLTPDDSTDWNAVQIARELTLMEHELLCPVSSWEFLHQAWNKSKKEDMAPNILALTEWFNRSSCWFSTKIIAKDTPDQRAAVVETIINIGMTFLQLRNFSGVMQVLACLNSSSIDRLQQTWGLLSSKTWTDFHSLNNLMSTEKNFKNYRQILKDLPLTEPCIPYLGMMLTDYTFMDDNNPKYLDEDERLVNLQRVQLIGAKMRELINYQTYSYKSTLQSNPDIRESILSERVWDDSEIFKMSKVREESSAKVEPRRGGKFGSTGRASKPRSTSLLGNSTFVQDPTVGLSNTEWELIMTNASKVQYQNGDVIFQEGIANSFLFRIIQGGVRFEKNLPDGPIVVARMGVGQVFGEMSFLGKNNTSAAAIADGQDSSVVLSVIETSFIDELFESEHELAATFYKHLAVLVAKRLKTTVASATKQSQPPSSPSPTASPTPSPPTSSPTPTSPPPSPSPIPSPRSPQPSPRATAGSPPPSTTQSSPNPAPLKTSSGGTRLAPPDRKLLKSPSTGSLPAPAFNHARFTDQRRNSDHTIGRVNSNGTGLTGGAVESSPPVNGADANDELKYMEYEGGKARIVDIKFGKRFKDLKDKVVIKVYVCKYGVSGSLYITKNYLCFFGKVLGMEKRKVIPWALVSNLEKTKHLIVEKQTVGGKRVPKKFLFKTASDLDEAFGIMSVIWRNQTRQLNASDDATRFDDDDSDSSESSEPNSARPGSPPDGSRRRPSTATAISKNMDLAVDIPGLPSKEDWNVILKGSKAVAFKEGEVIVHEGEKIQKVFQIMRGTCVVQRKIDGTDTVLTLSRMGTHDFFGEISFLLGEGASGSVVAGEGGAEVVSLGGDFVNILLSAKPQLASKFFKYLAVLLQKRLRSFQDRST